MNLAYNYQLIPDLRKVKDMERFIAGSYWENDVWNLNDPFWDDYSIGKKSFTSRRITFFEYPHPSLTSLHIKKSCTYSSTIRFSGKSKKISFRIIIFFIAIDRYCL